MGNPIDISIVIVNYRVKYFLEQTIRSAKEALRNLRGEIIVVDNNSGDGSLRKCRLWKRQQSRICHRIRHLHAYSQPRHNHRPRHNRRLPSLLRSASGMRRNRGQHARWKRTVSTRIEALVPDSVGVVLQNIRLVEDFPLFEIFREIPSPLLAGQRNAQHRHPFRSIHLCQNRFAPKNRRIRQRLFHVRRRYRPVFPPRESRI